MTQQNKQDHGPRNPTQQRPSPQQQAQGNQRNQADTGSATRAGQRNQTAGQSDSQPANRAHTYTGRGDCGPQHH